MSIIAIGGKVTCGAITAKDFCLYSKLREILNFIEFD